MSYIFDSYSTSYTKPQDRPLPKIYKCSPRVYVDVPLRVDSVSEGNAGVPLLERPVEKEFLPVEPLPYIAESQKLSVCWENLESTLQKINQFPNLRSLSLLNFNDERLEAFAEKFKIVPSLVTLDFSYGNRIGDKGAKILAHLYKENTNLRILHLDHNQIGDEGAEDFADLLMTNTSLSVLSFDRNQIGDVGAKALAHALEKNRGLTALELSHNQMGATGAQAIFDALKINRTLRDLIFFYEPPAPFIITRD